MPKYILLTVFILIITSGCMTRQQLQPTVSIEEFQEKSTQTSPAKSAAFIPEGNISPAQSLPTDNTYTDYLIGPGDLITITVFESEELNTESRISSRGDLSMPLLGRVQISGLAAIDAEKKIEQALIENYMHTAHVSLFIKERMNQHITLVGAVKQPGTFETQSRKRILEVLAFAGGLTETAGDTAYVTRKNIKDDSNQVFIVDLEALVTQGRTDMNMLIHGEDVIFIPQSDLIRVDGAVNRPGSFKIDGEMTIDNAIASAGGIARYADDEDIKLIRKNKEGKREIIQFTMDDILAMKKGEIESNESAPLQDVFLRDGDVIFVEVSGTRAFYSGVGFSVGFMGTGVTYKDPVNYIK